MDVTSHNVGSFLTSLDRPEWIETHTSIPKGEHTNKLRPTSSQRVPKQGMGISNAVGLAAAEAHLAAAYNKRLGRELRVGDDGE